MGENHHTHDARGKTNDKKDNTDPKPPCSGGGSDTPPPETHYSITCNHEKNWWDKWKPSLEIAGFITLAVYAAYTIGIYGATKKSADAATNAACAATKSANTAATQLELAERPWVSAGMVVDGPLDFNVNGANIHIKFHLQNSGPSPALNTVIEGQPVDSFFGPDQNPLDIRRKVCNQADQTIAKYSNEGIAIFPNGIPFEQTWTWTFNKADLDKYHGVRTKIPGKIVNPQLVVCVGYQPSFDKTRIYHTSYILDILKTNSKNVLSSVFDIGKNVPKNNLRLRLDFLGPIQAD